MVTKRPNYLKLLWQFCWRRPSQGNGDSRKRAARVRHCSHPSRPIRRHGSRIEQASDSLSSTSHRLLDSRQAHDIPVPIPAPSHSGLPRTLNRRDAATHSPHLQYRVNIECRDVGADGTKGNGPGSPAVGWKSAEGTVMSHTGQKSIYGWRPQSSGRYESSAAFGHEACIFATEMSRFARSSTVS